MDEICKNVVSYWSNVKWWGGFWSSRWSESDGYGWYLLSEDVWIYFVNLVFYVDIFVEFGDGDLEWVVLIGICRVLLMLVW